MTEIAIGALAPTETVAGSGRMSAGERQIIFASSLGTVFEWYDFYLYGSLAAIISKQFFSGVNPTAAFVFALMAFAAGFAVRPFGRRGRSGTRTETNWTLAGVQARRRAVDDPWLTRASTSATARWGSASRVLGEGRGTAAGSSPDAARRSGGAGRFLRAALN
jgi:hypothetical protein